MSNNKQVNPKDIELFEIQPSDKVIAEIEESSSLSDDDYEYLKAEIENYHSQSRKNYYRHLPKNNTEIKWNKPHVTRSKDELYAQLRFYDKIVTKEKLSKEQMNEVRNEVKQIYKELLEIDGLEYFLKHGHEKLRLDKLSKWEDAKDIKFFQRENDIIYDDTINEFVNIHLPIEKWWISEDDLIKHETDDLKNKKEYIDFNAKIKRPAYATAQFAFSANNQENKTNNVIEAENYTSEPKTKPTSKTTKKTLFGKMFHKNKNEEQPKDKKQVNETPKQASETTNDAASNVKPLPANPNAQLPKTSNQIPPSPTNLANNLNNNNGPKPTINKMPPPPPGPRPVPPRPFGPQSPTPNMTKPNPLPPPNPIPKPAGTPTTNVSSPTKQFFDYQNR